MTIIAEPQTLRAFVAVAREGNVSRAAQRLHLSQPAVSLQLKRLAQTTGLVLFNRTPRGLALTPDGAALLPQALEVAWRCGWPRDLLRRNIDCLSIV
jgi:DNA-binding transcriptional LysR family regulator